MNICVYLANLFKYDKHNVCNECDNHDNIINDKDESVVHKYEFTSYFENNRKKNNCMICLNSLNNKKVITRCNHKFHNKCILEWCNINNNCPMCRYNFPIG